MKKTRLLIPLVICLLFLSGCSIVNKTRISQDRLPWKASGDILFSDDFSDDSTGWEIVNNVYELKGYSREGYLISINHGAGRSISTTGLQFADVIVRVESRQLTGSSDSYLGVVCRYLDSHNYYRFFITPDGYAGIIRLVDGESSTLPGGETKYSHDVFQDDSVNVLEAACVGNKLTFHVNGKLVISVEDDLLTQGDIGIFAETGKDGAGSFIFNQFYATKP